MKTSVLQDVEFGHAGNSAAFQLYGWSIGEDRFTWTLGEESALLFPRTEAACGYFIEATMTPRIRPQGPLAQRLEILVNGKSIGRTVLHESCTIGFFAPPLHEFDSQMVVSLRHPDGFQEVPGARDFALAFARVRLLRLEEAADAPRHRISLAAVSVGEDCTAKDVDPIVRSLTGIGLRELLISFEMLAGNCEFGGVQRRLGAEPLGLLRFAGAVPETAIRGLDTGFAGIGETIEPYMSPDGADEWMIADKNYGLHYHTRLSATDMPDPAVVAKAEKRKIAFLLRKFTEDLQEDTKIYVSADRFGLPPEAMLPLYMALRRHGKRRLLWIVAADAGSGQPGTVEEIYPGLMRGYIDRFMEPGRVAESVPGWIAVLANAWLLCSGRTQPVVT